MPRVTFADSVDLNAFESAVHDQGSDGTCYAMAASTLVRDAARRAGRAAPEHSVLTSRLILEHGTNGGPLKTCVECMLRELNLPSERSASLRELDASAARAVLEKRRGKLGIIFGLDASQWARFSEFFRDHPNGFLTARHLRGPDGSKVEYHAAVIEVEKADGAKVAGAGALDHASYWVIKNSWGTKAASGGLHFVHTSALAGAKFYHVDVPLENEVPRNASWVERQASLREEFGTTSVPLDLTDEVSALAEAKELGSGTYGSVRAASLDGRPVAVKQAKTSAGGEKLRAEIKHLLAVTHSYVVPVLGVVNDGFGGWSLVMPRYARALQGKGSCDPSKVLSCIAEALAAVHAQGLIHGDVKVCHAQPS